MQLLRFFLIFILSFSAIWACEEPGAVRFRNKDNTVGGLIGPFAKVNADAYVAFNAKICGKAWVDGGAKILDRAIINGNAWIKEYSTVKDEAIVSDDAVLWGTRNAPVIVSGRSKIYNKAKILTGTVVSDDSEVYGEASLKDSKLSGQAKVCENYKITNQIIDDNYFCNIEENLSNSEVFLKSYNENSINKKKNYISFGLKRFNFSQDKNVFRVTLNGSLVESSQISIYRNQLIIVDNNLQVEGFNNVKIEGRDEYNKNLDSDGFDFYIGSGIKEIAVLNPENVEDNLVLDITYLLHGQEYKGSGRFQNNSIHLDSVPNGLDKYGIIIKGIGNTRMIYEEYTKLSDIPLSVESYLLPTFVNNNTDFSDDLVSWKKSHPENVVVTNVNNKNNIIITGSGTERVEISKRFHLNNNDGGMQFQFSLPVVSKFIINELPKAKVFLISLKDKKIISQNFNLNNLPNKNAYSSISNKTNGGDYILMIRLEPSVSFASYPNSFTILDVNISDVVIGFFPYQFNVRNQRGDYVPETHVLSSCTDPRLSFARMPNSATSPFKKSFDFQSFLSVGSMYELGGPIDTEKPNNRITSNKIYGTIDISGASRQQIDSIHLLVIQNDTILYELPLDTCSLNVFNNSESTIPFSSKSESLVGNLFAIPLPTIGIMLHPGSKVTLQLKVILKREAANEKFSNQTELTNLLVPNISKSQWFGGVDYYDKQEKSYLRTAGDKWILPAYAAIVENLLFSLPDWNINDLAKANGGDFPGHSGHKTGHEADFKFDQAGNVVFNFSLLQNVTNSKVIWNKVLDKIENFLIKNEDWYNAINTIFITRDLPDSDRLRRDPNWHGAIDEKFLQSRFQYRCFGNSTSSKFTRYIDFDELNPPGGKNNGKTLLNNEGGHWDHVHITYNAPSELSSIVGFPVLLNPIIPNLDLDSLWFNFNNDGTLIVTYKNQNSIPSYIKTFFRYQAIEGYNDVDDNIQFGKVSRNFEKSGKSNLIKPTFNKNVDRRWLHVLFADTRNGGCIVRTVQVSPSALSKFKRKWTYRKPAFYRMAK